MKEITSGESYSSHVPQQGESVRKFRGFVAIHESFLREIGGVASFGSDTIHESFLHKNLIFCQFSKVFSLESFPLYGIQAVPKSQTHYLFKSV